MEWIKGILAKAVITDGVLDVDATMESINTEFPKHAVPKITFNDVNEKLKTADATIIDLKKGNKDNEALQKTIRDHETTIKTLEADAKNTSKTSDLKEKLAAEGVTDPDYLIYKHGGVDKFNFDTDGKAIGVKEVVEPYKESLKHIFKTDPTKPKYDPAGGGGASGANPWKKDTFNLTEQGKMYKENPAQAKELASAAGVEL